MYSPYRRAALVLLLGLSAPAHAGALRACADPNNLPFSNAAGEGFENRIAELVAKDLGEPLQYAWRPQRRGFIRTTLSADLCDLVPGVPVGLGMLRTTTPYYRSTYVFVTRSADRLDLASLDDERLRTLRIGVQLIGDDGINPPPAHALARRGIVANVRGFTVYGDYAQPDPPARIVAAVAEGTIDVAIAWGPLAGYFATRQKVPLSTAPVEPQVDASGLPMTFAIAMGVRRDNTALRDKIDAILKREQPRIDAILADYGVPLVEVPKPEAAQPP